MSTVPAQHAVTEDSPSRLIAPAHKPGLVELLQTATGYPCVSVLMTTTPAARLDGAQAAQLRSMCEQALRRLHAEHLLGARTVIGRRLSELVDVLEDSPAGAALGLYASSAMAQAVQLTLPVVDRVVVDPSFATRDIVRSLHRTPRHLVLALAPGRADLLEGVAGSLATASASGFPLLDHATATDRAHPGETEFLRRGDRLFASYFAAHPAPVVLLGTQPAVTRFYAVSRHLGRLAGVVTTEDGLISPEVLQRIREVLDGYLHSRQREALELVRRRAEENHLVSGIARAWVAARHERPEMLIVDDGLYYPARLLAGGDVLEPASDVEHPEVLDDAVDELIELVLDRGGWVALAEPGTLSSHEQVALTLREW
jgi:hypothetical protein